MSSVRASRPKPDEARERTRAYLAAQPAAARRGLRAIRDAIRAAVPGAVEGFSYGIPGFRLDGRPLLWYAAWKEHWSLYPITAGMRDAHAAELGEYPTSKGTVRFAVEDEIPVAFVRRLAKARAAEIRAAAAPRSGARSSRASSKSAARAQPRRPSAS